MTKTPRILVVDDNPVETGLLTYHISRNTDSELITADRGEEALELLEKDHERVPDLVLLDVVMPGMDGFRMAKHLKDNERTKDIPIIFITSLDDVESKVRAFEHGGVDYICKPFNKDELLARINAHIRLKTLGDELRAKNKELDVLNRQLERRKEELEQLNQQKNQFIGIVAHDLRNPITVIMGTGELLKMKLNNMLDQKQLKYLTMIKSSSLFMLNLINDLIDIHMVESGELTLRKQWTDMTNLMRQNVELNNFLSEYKNTKIRFDCAEEGVNLFVDPSRVEQILNNLVSNAVKFSEEGSTVRLGLKAGTSHVEITVSDEGQGIPPEDLRTIFKPYERASVRPTAGEKGTGLGLAIVKKVVEGHNGTIKVESEVGKGSMFTVSLPMEVSPES